MGDQAEATRQSDFIRPPRAGEMACIAVSTSASVQDLGAISYQLQNMANMDSEQTYGTGGPGCVGHFITVYADGSDLGVIFGPTVASVSGGNAPVFATQGVNSAGVCARIPAGQERNWKITPQDRYLGFVGSGAGSMRIYQSST